MEYPGYVEYTTELEAISYCLFIIRLYFKRHKTIKVMKPLSQNVTHTVNIYMYVCIYNVSMYIYIYVYI